jgi:hypothetical protein
MDGFVFTVSPDASTAGVPDASTAGVPDASTAGVPDVSVEEEEEEENMLLILPNTPDDVGFPDASVVGFPDASVEEEENMLLTLSNIPPDASVTGFPDASVEEENGDERLNASLFDENNALIGAAPFKNDFIILFISNELL